MRFKDILNAISNGEIIVESDEVPSILGKRKEYMNIRNVNREKMTNSKELYKDDQRYNDYQGKQWLNTTASDKLTLTIAILDGCADTNKDGLKHEDYMNIKTKEDLDRILANRPRVKSLVSEVLKFLGKYLNQKEITVYRGINIVQKKLSDMYSKDRLSRLNPQRLISYFSNEGKEFNSFSVNPEITKKFAKEYGGNSKNYVILQGKANKQDINWAFTAYLMGRHGTTAEAELNINNIRTLKDLHIVTDASRFINKTNKKTIIATNDTLKDIIKSEITKYGDDVDLNHIDVSNVTDMTYMFLDSKFNGDISSWDVSNVTDMSYMFFKSEFNGDISNWDVSNVTDMAGMFWDSKFNGDISNWDVSNVTNMSYMFCRTWFLGSISNWDVSNVTNMSNMFDSSYFNGDISNWDVSNVTDMINMFKQSEFNGDISNWDVSNVTYMHGMFRESRFNGDISKWLPVMKKNCIDIFKIGYNF